MEFFSEVVLFLFFFGYILVVVVSFVVFFVGFEEGWVVICVLRLGV